MTGWTVTQGVTGVDEFRLPRIHPDAVTRAAGDLPGWLADQVRNWITEREDRGHQFVDSGVAVEVALREMGVGR